MSDVPFFLMAQPRSIRLVSTIVLGFVTGS
jgi:hypothetical protein